MIEIEPFYFGPENRIFGIFHPAPNNTRPNVVIAPPLLSEHMRAHRILRNIAIQLAHTGHNVLRFDYTGLGNSLGVLKNLTLDDWAQDIKTAISELSLLSGQSSVIVISVRFAAALVHRVAQTVSLSGHLSWDPIVNASDWLSANQRFEAAILSKYRYGIHENERLGHLVSPGFDESARGFDVNDSAGKIVAVFTDRQSRNHDFPDFELVEHDCSWEGVDSTVLYSLPIVNRFCDLVSRI